MTENAFLLSIGGNARPSTSLTDVLSPDTAPATGDGHESQHRKRRGMRLMINNCLAGRQGRAPAGALAVGMLLVMSVFWLNGCTDEALGPIAPLSSTTAAHPDTITMASSVMGAFAATVDLRIDPSGMMARGAVAGSNIQWIDGGDNLISDWHAAGETGGVNRLGGSLALFRPWMLDAVEGLSPGSLRFPGGTMSDVYHWRGGVGPVSARSSGEHVFQRKQQKMLFGTGEFLALARRVGAEPIITVNVPTGTAQEAADWVGAVNVRGLASVGGGADVTGSGMPPGTPTKVRYWELGNEPYLEESSRPELTLDPRAYSAKALAIANAMRAADPGIQLGLPLRRDLLGPYQQVRFPGYADAVLRALATKVDFIALHNGYLPFTVDGLPGGASPDAGSIFRALMAASRVVEEDIEAVRTMWAAYRPGVPAAIAVTEYSAVFTLGGVLDRYVSSLGSAIYAADVLRVLASSPNVIMANYWSLSGNGWFGAFGILGEERPVSHVLRAYRQALRGRIVRTGIASPTLSSPAIGVVPAYDSTPAVAVFATHEGGASGQSAGMRSELFMRGPSQGPGGGSGSGGRMRVLLINKDPARAAATELRMWLPGIQRRSPAGAKGSPILSSRASTLDAGSENTMLASSVSWRSLAVSAVSGDDLKRLVILPPASVTFVEMDLR